MRSDFVFLDSSVNPSFFFTTPARKPRTECGCQPVTFEIAAMVLPPLAWSRPMTRSCLVAPRRERDARGGLVFVFDLSCLAGLCRRSDHEGLRGRRHHRRTTSTPPRPTARGVRSGGAALALPAVTATLRSQQKSSPTSSNLVARSHPCRFRGQSGRRARSGRACRSARAFQTSTCSAIAKASSTSMPGYRTVLSILVCPSRS